MYTMQKTTAIILSAGSGRRLYPYTKDKPKCLVEVNNIAILHYQLTALKKVHITHVILVLGFQEELVKDFVRKNFPSMHFSFIYNENYLTTNTLYSLALSIPIVPTKETILIINGDVLFDDKTLSLYLIASSNDSSAIIRKGVTTEEDVKVLVNSKMQIEEINKQIPTANAFGEAVGIYKLSSLFWKHLSKNLQKLKNEKSMEYYEYAFEKTITDTIPLYAKVLGEELACEIDTPEDLKATEVLLKNHPSLKEKNVTIR